MTFYAKQLLNELPSEDTVHDWVFGSKDGFLRYVGKAQEYLGRTDPKGSSFLIPFHKNNTHSMVIRFPGVGVLSIIGFNVGLYGAVSFAKLYKKCWKISALYFVLSNVFFSGMNAAGLIYHCILPNDFKWRYIFRYVDQICTGIAGVFMSIALQSIHKEINNDDVTLYLDEDENEKQVSNEWGKEKQTIYCIVGSVMVLPIIHPIFGDIIYIGGVLSSVYNVLQCNLKLRQYDDDKENDDNELKYLKAMAKTVLFLSGITGIGVLAAKNVALWSNGKVNVMRTMFMFSDIGYMFTLYYGMKHYIIKHK